MFMRYNKVLLWNTIYLVTLLHSVRCGSGNDSLFSDEERRGIISIANVTISHYDINAVFTLLLGDQVLY